MNKPLTLARIERFQWNPKRADRQILWDSTHPGLGVRVRATGTKTYVMQWGDRTNRRLVTLGGIYEHTVDQAKEWWREQREQERRGIDLVQTKKGLRQKILDKDTLSDLIDAYLADEDHEWSESHLKDSRRRGEVVKRELGPLLPKELKAKAVKDLHKKITKTGHHKSKRPGVGSAYEANKVSGFIHALYAWASESDRGYELEGFQNPAYRRRHRRSKKAKQNEGIGRNKAHKRQRVLLPKEGEYLRLLTSADSTGDPIDGVILRLFMLTGLRRKELLLRRWSDVNLEERVMLIPGDNAIPGSTKNGKDHFMPLCDRAVELLKSLRDPKIISIDRNAPIFTVPDGDPRFGKPITQDFSGWWESTWRKIRHTADLRCWGKPNPGFRLQDLRRTVSTWLHEYRAYTDGDTGRLLNHTPQSPSVTAQHYVTDLGGILTSNRRLVADLQDFLEIAEGGKEAEELKTETLSPAMMGFGNGS